MSEVARLWATIGADMTEFDAGMAKAGRDWAALGQRMNAVGQKMTLGITAPLLALAGVSTKVPADFEALEIGLTAVTGSAATAADQIARLREIAKLPAVDLQQATEASLAFQAIGKDAEFAERMIKGVANAVALSGGGAENFSGVIRQMRQVAGLGRLMGEEMNIIVENAPVMAKAIQQAFGTSSTEAIQKMGLTTDEFFERMMQALETLPQVAGGAKNSIENLGQALRQAAETIGDQLLPAIIPVIESVSKWAEDLREMNPEIIRWGIAIGAAAALMGPLAFAIGTVTTAVGLLVAAFGAALLPLIGVGGAIILGLGALAAMFVENRLKAAAFRAELEKLNDVTTFSGEQLQAEEQRLMARQRELIRLQKEKEGILATLDSESAIYRNIDRDLQKVNAEYGQNLSRLAEIRGAMQEITTLPPVTMPTVGTTDAAAMDKHVETLTEAVRLGLASAEQQQELRRLQSALHAAAQDANRPLERRIELLGQAREAMAAILESERRHLLMTEEQTNRLRLGQGGTVLAGNLPTAEGELAALGISEMSESMQELQRTAGGVGFAFADAFGSIVSGTQTAADAFRNLAQSIIRDLAAMIARLAIFHGLMALFGAPTLGKVFGGSFLGFDIGSASNVTASNVVSSGVTSNAVSAAAHPAAPPVMDFSTFPPARNPLEAARDADWQRFFRESGIVATSQGFSFAAP